ncbi:MAG TPA: AMP-binding protein, partial [Kineosporiaceae bacterium]|nr:AMP-binding protein [Kineosporiaceae bacterium]
MTSSTSTSVYSQLRAARDQLLQLREDYPAARERFRWPRPPRINWARDWLDPLAVDPVAGARPALWIVEEDGSEVRLSYAEIAQRSARLAAWLQGHGVSAGDRVLVMLGNQVELWETVVACIRLGAVVIPATTLLAPADLRDRLDRGAVRHVIARSGDAGKFVGLRGGWTPIAVGAPVTGWLDYAQASRLQQWSVADADTRASDPLLLYFTSGTTALPKLVEHTHSSYPVGHLSTLYWIGLQPGDVHLNISSPGWAKHAWSNLFAPWLAEACALVVNQSRFAARPLLETMARCGVTTFCAPPTVWRMLVQTDLASWRGRIPLREVVGAGEPLNAEVIDQVQQAWGLTVRDGFGQTETTAQVGNTPGQKVVPGSMGRPLPGYDVVLADPVTGQVRTGDGEGEICLRLDAAELGRPLGLMTGYRDDPSRTAEAMRDGLYHTGDVASVDADGYITCVGRADDVFKASD